MAPRSAPFRQADVTRAVKAALACGLAVVRTEITPDGTIRLFHDKRAESDSLTPFQRWKAEQDARAG